MGAPMMEIQKKKTVPETIAKTLRSSDVVIFLSINAIEYSLIKSTLIPFVAQKKYLRLVKVRRQNYVAGLDSFFLKKKRRKACSTGLDSQNIKTKNVAF